MKQEFYNLEINTNGQKLYEFTDETKEWIYNNNFKNGINDKNKKIGITIMPNLIESVICIVSPTKNGPSTEHKFPNIEYKLKAAI